MSHSLKITFFFNKNSLQRENSQEDNFWKITLPSPSTIISNKPQSITFIPTMPSQNDPSEPMIPSTIHNASQTGDDSQPQPE